LYIDKKGNIISCADEDNEIWQISTAKKTKVLVKNFNGKRLNGPNDLWIHPKGDIYFTDPFYKRDYWKHTQQEQPGQYLFYYNQKSRKTEPVDTTFQRPNGIVGTGDGKYLFVADIGAGKTYRYEIEADGKLSNKTLFAPQGSDGMTIDRDGNLYLTGKGVTVYNPAGTKIAQIPVPANWTANLCFSGKDKDVLFITASESVFTLKMKVKGY
jgi:gluconolactonase